MGFLDSSKEVLNNSKDWVDNNIIDRNQNNKNDFSDLMNDVGNKVDSWFEPQKKTTNSKPSKSKTDNLFEKYDKNKDGKIDGKDTAKFSKVLYSQYLADCQEYSALKPTPKKTSSKTNSKSNGKSTSKSSDEASTPTSVVDVTDSEAEEDKGFWDNIWDDTLSAFENMINSVASAIENGMSVFDEIFSFDETVIIDAAYWMDKVAYSIKDTLPSVTPDIDILKNKIYNFPISQLEKARPYEKDTYMEHRLEMNPTYLRIGDCVFDVPPTNINITTSSHTDTSIGIRQNSAIKRQSGYSTRAIRLVVPFCDVNSINGYPIESPFGGCYYVDGLRALIAQFKRTPFLPIDNEHINAVHGIYNVSLTQLIVTNVPDFPNYLQAELILKEFNIEPYLETHGYEYRNMIDWDLFRWYYQQLLDKKSSSSVYLQPVNQISKDIEFYVVNIDKLELEDLGDNGISDKFMNLNELVEDDKIELAELDFTVNSMTVSMANSIPDIQLSNYRIPTSQFMGASDTMINIMLETTDEYSVSYLNQLKENIDMYSREERERNLFGFTKIKNDLLQLFGHNYFFIETMTCNTVPDFPGLFAVELSLLSFDPGQKQRESLYRFTPFERMKGDTDSATSPQIITQDINGIRTQIRQDIYAEQKFQNVNLYPDLDLPSYNKVNKVLKKINEYKIAKDIKGGIVVLNSQNGQAYVDADFYICYKDYKTDLDLLDPLSKDAILNQFQCNSKVMKQVKAREVNGVNVVINDSDNKTAKIDKLYLPAFGADIMVRSEIDSVSEVATKVASFTAERMCHDMAKYSHKGRLSKAFPSYLVVIIDECCGWLDGKKPWSNYYMCHSVLDVNVHSNRKNPTSTAMVSLSNCFKVISNNKWRSQLKNQERVKFDFLSPNLTDEILENHYELLNTINITAGNRLHIRLGYGNDASSMPITFNGTVTEVQHGLVTQLVAQSDGLELINSVLKTESDNDTNGSFNYGLEASNVIGNVMTEIDGKTINKINKGWGENSKYGIEHFGIRIGTGLDVMNTGKDMSIFSLKIMASTINNFTLVPNLFLNCFDGDKNDISKCKPMTAETEHKVVGDAFNKVTNIKYSKKQTNLLLDRGFNVKGMSWWKEYDIVKNIYTSNPKSFESLTDQKNLGGKIMDIFNETLDCFKVFGDDFSDDKNMFGSLFDDGKSIIGNVGDMFSTVGDVFGIDGENNAAFYMHNKTPYDLFQNVTSVSPEFICYPHYHGFHSTLFFGSPTWNVKYKYGVGSSTVPDDVLDKFAKSKLKTLAEYDYHFNRETQVWKDYGNDSHAYHLYEHIKPFSQFHFISSGSDIIDNQIIASGKGIKATNCVPVFTCNKETKMGDTVYADTSIFNYAQKTKVVDTTFFSNIPFVPGILEDGARFVGDMFSINPTEDKVRLMGVSYLTNSFKDMYQGSLIMLGRPEIKPYDVLYVYDEYADMAGICEVEQVVHSLSPQGLITTINPDLCTFSTEDIANKFGTYMNLMKIGNTLSTIDLLRANTFYAKAIDEMLYAFNKRKLTHWVGATLVVGTGIQTLRCAWKGARGSLQAYRNIRAAMKGIKGVKTAKAVVNTVSTVNNTNKVVSTALTVAKGAKDIATVSTVIEEGMIAGAALTSETIIGPIIILAVGLTIQSILKNILKFIENRNVIKIWPMLYQGRPYVAGIRGSQNLIPGFDDDEDNVLTSTQDAMSAFKEFPQSDNVLKYVASAQVDDNELKQGIAEYNRKVYNKEFPVMKNNALYKPVHVPTEKEKKGGK